MYGVRSADRELRHHNRTSAANTSTPSIRAPVTSSIGTQTEDETTTKFDGVVERTIQQNDTEDDTKDGTEDNTEVLERDE